MFASKRDWKLVNKFVELYETCDKSECVRLYYVFVVLNYRLKYVIAGDWIFALESFNYHMNSSRKGKNKFLSVLKNFRQLSVLKKFRLFDARSSFRPNSL